jgi:hypothetical protein
MKKLLILSGPQGSGNHVWSKIFALHPTVFGWQALLDEYWIGHDREPFSDCWRDPQKLRQFDWTQKDFYVTSISVPYVEQGIPTVPDIAAFKNICQELGIITELIAIGRDRNVLSYQETRVRGEPTYKNALESYKMLGPSYYLSYELLQLYRQQYLITCSRHLDFPIALDDPRIESIINEDANQKYFQPIDSHWVDELVKKAAAFRRQSHIDKGQL